MTRFRLVIACLIGLALTPAARAADLRVVHFAYLTAVDLLPYYVADKKGYFAEEGLKVDPLIVTSGAAVAGAVMGGTADFGYAGSVPIISARVEGLPLKFFSGLALDQAPNYFTVVYIASPKSGVKSAKDLKGKVVGMNARAGQCELIARLALKQAGVSLSDVNITTIPFPQMQAALELGTLDVACTNDPFLTSMRQAGLNTVVMKGLVSPEFATKPHLHSGLFSSESWLAANGDVAVKIRAALDKAIKEIAANDSEARAILAEYTKISPNIIKDVQFSQGRTDLPKSAVQPVIDAAFETGIIPKRIDADALIATLPAK